MEKIYLLVKSNDYFQEIVAASPKPFGIKSSKENLSEIECSANAWVTECHEQYKCREPGFWWFIVTELQAKLALVKKCNEHLPDHLKKKRLPQGTSEITHNYIKYCMTEKSFTFEYTNDDVYCGGIKIFPVTDYLKQRS